MKKKIKKVENKWHKFLVVGLVILTTGSVSLQSIVALGNNSASNDKKVKNEIEKQENIQKYIPGQVIIKLKEGVSYSYEFLGKHELKSAEKVLKENKSGKNVKAEQAMKKYGLDRIYLAEFSVEKDITKVIKKLNNDPRVEYAELNYIYRTTLTPNDLSDELWGLYNTGQNGGTDDADIDAPEAWGIETGGHEVVIAVIDTGVDYNHEDLEANMWTNSGETADGKDTDENGFVDDIRGWDFANGDNDPFDDVGHGTHCAGTIGAVGDNGKGIVGVNWKVTIMPIKFLGLRGGTTANAILSVKYAVDNGADIMSNSWGGGVYSVALEEAISAADDAGILFIASAGNNGKNTDRRKTYPAGYNIPNVISVAATDRNDELASWSNYGIETVDLGAPGVAIYSTVPTGSCELCDSSGYKYLGGTSMACPHVAGAAGLIKAHYSNLTSDELKAKLLGGVDLISSLEEKTVTGGRLNAYNSLNNVGENLPPTANAGPDQTVYDVDGSGFEKITLNSSGSSDPEGGALLYEWKEGNTVLGSNASFSDDFSVGIHKVTLTVTDNSGATGIDEVIITVTGDVTADIVTVDSTVYDEEKYTLTIKAKSTMGSEAVLTVNSDDFASKVMRYDSRLGMFKVTVRKVISNSGVGIIKSSLDGSAKFSW